MSHEENYVELRKKYEFLRIGNKKEMAAKRLDEILPRIFVDY